jgi:hypothetical protein
MLSLLFPRFFTKLESQPNPMFMQLLHFNSNPKRNLQEFPFRRANTGSHSCAMTKIIPHNESCDKKNRVTQTHHHNLMIIQHV